MSMGLEELGAGGSLEQALTGVVSFLFSATAKAAPGRSAGEGWAGGGGWERTLMRNERIGRVVGISCLFVVVCWSGGRSGLERERVWATGWFCGR